MFKRSENKQGDLFGDITNKLSPRKQKMLDCSLGWHNIFHFEVISRIDESPYSVLYHQKTGRPNASVRILLGMMILKEGQGWSDEQLFEECRFNIKVMRALGLFDLRDDIPVESTYYEFRKLLGDYTENHDHDLVKQTFRQITTEQVAFHGVSGKKIRLDSKLINSNIARSNRLHLVVEAVRKYVSNKNLEELRSKLDDSDFELVEQMQQCSASNITYPLNGSQKRAMLITIGELMMKLLSIYKGSECADYKILKRIYEDQYEQKDKNSNKDDGDNDKDYSRQSEKEGVAAIKEANKETEVVPKQGKDISSSSVQSIHDPEAAYRTKGQGASKQTVCGYHANITESCDPKESVHLILDVEVVAANECEDTFLLNGIEESQNIIKQANGEDQGIEEVITDGGYDSVANRKEMLKDDKPTWSLAKMKGGRHVYHMEYNDKGDLEVYDSKGDQQYEVHFSERAKKYVIKTKDGGKRYMTEEQVENYIVHQQIENQVSKESYNLRATVESTIHQTFHRLKKNNKMVYRGLIKCQWYVLSRAFWVNVVRIRDKNTLIMSFLSFWHLANYVEALIPKSTIKIQYQKYKYKYKFSQVA